jgi:hypothetical protein
MLKNICGTFLEVHRPFDVEVLASKELTSYNVVDTLQIETYPAGSLCAGKYEVRNSLSVLVSD